MLFTGCEPKEWKNCAASRPCSLPRPAPYQVGSYFKAFPSYKTATWETQLDGKKEEHSWTALEANCFTWTRRQPRKRALFGVICPTWRRILGKAEESSWVMFKAHLRDLARSWGGINFAWAGWHDEAFRCCVICLPFFEIRHLAQSLCLWEGTWVSGMVAIRETCTGSSMWGRHLSICQTGWDLASADLWTGNKEGDIRAARSVTRVLSSRAQVKTRGDILSWTTYISRRLSCPQLGTTSSGFGFTKVIFNFDFMGNLPI